jgi:DNA-binding PadR family transcriptional regulator
MPKDPSDRIDLLQGTLDMLILRTLLFGLSHGHQIAKHIQRTTEDVLQVEHGSLYPALHRLERKGYVSHLLGHTGGLVCRLRFSASYPQGGHRERKRT